MKQRPLVYNVGPRHKIVILFLQNCLEIVFRSFIENERFVNIFCLVSHRANQCTHLNGPVLFCELGSHSVSHKTLPPWLPFSRLVKCKLVWRLEKWHFRTCSSLFFFFYLSTSDTMSRKEADDDYFFSLITKTIKEQRSCFTRASCQRTVTCVLL